MAVENLRNRVTQSGLGVYRHWRLLIEATLVVIPILGVKVIADLVGWEFVGVSPLLTSIVAGGIFILSILLSGTLADYKECEKMPSEIAASLEAIHDEGRYVGRFQETFPVGLLAEAVRRISAELRNDLAAPGSRGAVRAVGELTPFFVQMEKLGIPPNYIVRLKQEQGNLRRSLLRIYHIQRTRFVPSAYILLTSMTVLIVGLLIFTEVDPRHDGMILVGFISFLLVYILMLIRTIDTPFRIDEYTMDDVSLFLLRETDERIRADAAT